MFSVCYMESPDVRWRKNVYVLSRDPYPAGKDGIPQIVPVEYTNDNGSFRQDFVLLSDKTYKPYLPVRANLPDLEETIRMKNRMKRIFLKKPEEVLDYELQQDPSLKLKERDAIVMSRACQDPKLNTDGGFGRYELYDLCDEGILFWDPACEIVEVEFYLRDTLMKARAKRLLCLKYEDIITCDPEGNSGYKIPIVYTKYGLGENPFKYYYLDEKQHGIISNSVIAGIRE